MGGILGNSNGAANAALSAIGGDGVGGTVDGRGSAGSVGTCVGGICKTSKRRGAMTGRGNGRDAVGVGVNAIDGRGGTM